VFKAKHAQLKGADRLHVLGPLSDVAGFFELVPDPREDVYVAGVGEASTGLGQFCFFVAGEDREEGLGRAVAHYVVAFEHDEALLEHVGVGFGKHTDPGHARDLFI